MNRLFVRLVASGLMSLTVGAGAAFADNASIGLTGPGSTNIVSNPNFNNFRSNINNHLNSQNFNDQFARSGNVGVFGNNFVHGSGLRSGDAFNVNSARNNVFVANQNPNWWNGCGNSWGNSWGGNSWNGNGCGGNWNNGWGGNGFGGNGFGGNGQIFLTGPNSFNQVLGGNRSNFTSNIRNNVNAQNFNNQNARSGNVTVTGNTLVTGVGGSGNASNFNSAQNNIGITNNTPTWFAGNWGPTGNAVISTTGPGSFNQLANGTFNRTLLNTTNNVNATNSNFQNAQSGDVNIRGNTVVSGVGGSGNATNWNSAANGVSLLNN